MQKIGYLIISCLFVACTAQPDLNTKVHECAPAPFARACATSFVVDGQAYIFGGRANNTDSSYNDLWMYSPATDQWTSLGATPLQARVNATACVHEGLVYIGLGFAGGGSKDSLYLRDWWVYNPKENSWTALADYPNSYTDCASAFVGEKELYVGYGFCWQYRRDMFRYNIRENTWDSIDVGVAFHGYPTRSFGGTGTTCQKRHFMGTGYYRYSLDWWAELVDGTHWEERTPVPGRTRTLAKTTATENYIYLSGGMHYGGVATTAEVLQDIRRYDPQNDQWTYVAILPERLFNHITFAIGKRIYFGLGETEEWKVQNKLYYIEE